MGKRKSVSKLPPPITPLRGSSRTPTHREKADLEKWTRHDLWRIEEAIMLLLGLEPFNVNADYWNEPPEYKDLYKLALGSRAIGALKFHSAVHVQPSVFVEWATSKGLPGSDELRSALPNREKVETKFPNFNLKQLTPKTKNEINQDWQNELVKKAINLIEQKKRYKASKGALAKELGKEIGIDPGTIERQTRKTW